MKLVFTRLFIVGLLFCFAEAARAQGGPLRDSIPLTDRRGDFLTDPARNPIDLRDPSAVTKDVQYDPATGRYLVTEKIGDAYFRSPTYLTFEEYQAYRERQRQSTYFDRLQGVSTGQDGGNGLADPIDAVDVENDLIDRLFGGKDLNIQTRGNVDLTLGFDYRTTLNPAIITRAQRQGGFLFNMNIQMNVTGSIGTKLTLSSSYNTQSNFSFDRQLIKVAYNAAEFSEDEIIQDIQIGNVALPLRSNLIQGSQGLLGVRTDLKFGDLKVTAIASQQKTKRGQIETVPGVQRPRRRVRREPPLLPEPLQPRPVRGRAQEPPEHRLAVQDQTASRSGSLTTATRPEGVRDLIALTDLGEGDRITNPNATDINPTAGKSIGGQFLPDNEVNRLYETLTDNPSTRLRQNAVGPPPGSAVPHAAVPRFRARAGAPLERQEYSYHPRPRLRERQR